MYATAPTDVMHARHARLLRATMVGSLMLALAGCAHGGGGTAKLALNACNGDPSPTAALRCAANPPPEGSVADAGDTDTTATGSLSYQGAASARHEPLPILAETATGAKPSVDRDAVMDKVASVAPDLTGTVAPAGKPTVVRPLPTTSPNSPGGKIASGKVPATGSLTLKDAVAIAVLSHPLMGAQAAKIQGTAADVKFAKGARLPQVDVFAGVGHATLGSFSNDPAPFNSGGAPGLLRADTGFTFKQLIFDFGVARAEVQRNEALVDAERLKLADEAEDIGLRTVNAYLNLLEQSELISMIDHTVAEQHKLAQVVRLNQQGGNGTQADVDRIKAKIIEIEAMRTDIDTNYRTALDEFRRLTGLEPRQVRRPRAIAGLIPKGVGAAIADAGVYNPALLSIKSTGRSFAHQLEGQNAQRFPRLDLQGDGLVKNYYGVASAASSVVDVRAMVTLSYKLYDGGQLRSQTEHTRASQQANEFKYLDQQEAIELTLRRFYQSLAANRAKREAAVRGVDTARNVNMLYTEQFKAGKRTIFEVLDSNMVVFTMQKNRINGEFEELRATYGILRAIGRLGETIAAS
ncbi:MAG: TolC family protein [Siculibacillus sp.]